MKVASIDIGSNSFLLCVMEIKRGNWEIILEKANIVKIGELFERKEGYEEKILEKAKQTLKNYLLTCKKYNVKKILPFGTQFFRENKNNFKILENFEKILRTKIKILSEFEEGKYAYIGVVFPLYEKLLSRKILLFDIGGRSTEIILGEGLKIIKVKSFKTGFLREKNDKITKSTFQINGIHNFFGIGGTVVNLAKLKYKIRTFDFKKIEGKILTFADIKELIKKINSKEIDGIEKGREDTIIKGANIVLEIMEEFNFSSFQVSTRGARHGIIFEEFLVKREE